MKKTEAPGGFWESPITADLVAAAGNRLSDVQCDQGNVYWLELRPLDRGRQVIVCQTPDGKIETCTPNGFCVRSRVHEYGGGDYRVRDGIIYFVNDDDQCIYRQAMGGYPEPVTFASKKQRAIRYADLIVTNDQRYLIAVREVHSDDAEPVNEIVLIHLNIIGDVRVLVTGADFYANPRLNPDETQLTWISWSHPNMPWDASELWLSALNAEKEIANSHRIAGGASESLYQPEWSPQGELYVVSDRTGWWNIYRVLQDELISVAPMPAECGETQWVFGTRMYAFLEDGRIVAIVTQKAQRKIGIIQTGRWVPLQLPCTMLSPYLAVADNQVYCIASNACHAPYLIGIDILSDRITVIAKSMSVHVDKKYLSTPIAIEFPTDNQQTAHAFFYAPNNADYCLPKEALPPLIVICHGGPVAATSMALNLKIQFWTSRGFAVVDVNYGGSAGFGRAYRNRLISQWGVVDVADCVHAARFLVAEKRVDSKRLCIRGGSAGGFTVLCALTFYDDFTAGASYYGVSDLQGLLADTHKFESRALDNLVGSHLQAADRYHDRSPVNFANQIQCPIIFFQGLEDKVVPPQQAETMIEAMKQNDLLYRYVTFPEEQHGFRMAKNIITALSEELNFYQSVFSS